MSTDSQNNFPEALIVIAQGNIHRARMHTERGEIAEARELCRKARALLEEAAKMGNFGVRSEELHFQGMCDLAEKRECEIVEV